MSYRPFFTSGSGICLAWCLRGGVGCGLYSPGPVCCSPHTSVPYPGGGFTNSAEGDKRATGLSAEPPMQKCLPLLGALWRALWACRPSRGEICRSIQELTVLLAWRRD